MMSAARGVTMASNVTLSISSPNLGAVIKRISAAGRELARLGVPYKKASVYLDQWVQRNFQTSGGKVGGWLPLRAGGRWVGKGKKRRLDANAKPLINTGALRHSFLPFSTDKEAGIGSRLSYSATHQWGDKSKGVPQRRILPKRAEVMPDIKDIFDKHVQAVAKGLQK